jgi:multimeric flavodoxin WrbA
MKSTFKILTILGSPHNGKSNTKALVNDFVEDLEKEGLELDHEIISLGRKKVEPCKGCWNCTYERPCRIKDDLEEIKIKMIECDMLILASPVYTNQVTAQMKAFFDRLFTWCHIFPLLGKYSLSIVTTGNDGHNETAAFLEKMLATYGTFSFGSIKSIGALTPGFFPWRAHSRSKNKKKARKVASTILKGKLPATRKIQRKMFRAMKLKMTGMHTVNCLQYGIPEGQPKPNPVRVKLMNMFFRKVNITKEQLNKWAGLLAFELAWWRDRNWLDAKSLKQLMDKPIPESFHVTSRLLNNR